MIDTFNNAQKLIYFYGILEISLTASGRRSLRSANVMRGSVEGKKTKYSFHFLKPSSTKCIRVMKKSEKRNEGNPSLNDLSKREI